MKRVFHQKKKEIKNAFREYKEAVMGSGVEVPGLPSELALSEDKTFEEEFAKDEEQMRLEEEEFNERMSSIDGLGMSVAGS